MDPTIKVIEHNEAFDQYNEPTFVLKKDIWNDYSYRTQYHLYLQGSPADKTEDTFIGTVKILFIGQTGDGKSFIHSDFQKLPENAVSVGQSLDYYQRLSVLQPHIRDSILIALNDVAFDSKRKRDFDHLEGWRHSLFRYLPAIDDYLTTANAVLTRNYTAIPVTGFKFTFHPADWEEPILFDFTSAPSLLPFPPNVHPLPSRIITLIGRNGSGKSTLLARLARVAHGTTKNRELGIFNKLGTIEPISIGFPRIITVSYSAFDNFTLPGVKPSSEEEPDERVQIVHDTNSGSGRFIFCGLRDIATELSNEINEEKNINFDPSGDKSAHTLLKPVTTLAKEFAATLVLAKRNGSAEMLDRALALLVRDPSFPLIANTLSVDLLLQMNPKELFMSWSTGHKIVMQILVSLAANVTQGTLVLIDEPETHLHPPLLAALMHAIRLILSYKNAFSIIATHSPVVIQETLSKHVYRIKREGSLTNAFPTNTQTFGENVGALTTEIFGLNTQATDFHKVLDSLIDSNKTLENIEMLFLPHGLSMQARAYVMSKLAMRLQP
ncbi:ATP-binding protein [Pseudomonas sp. RL_5y_Pfl2_70]|uniref:ATP-binding protein n=1 Tax=Pseudomonas sp. RL_5y_Pfl2_70 TaxID=3088712 RepID=UPI0030DD0B13